MTNNEVVDGLTVNENRSVTVRLAEPPSLPTGEDDGVSYPTWDTDETNIRVKIWETWANGLGEQFEAMVDIQDDERRRIEIPPKVAEDGYVPVVIEAERDNNGMTEDEAQDAMMYDEQHKFGDWSEPTMWMDVPAEDDSRNVQHNLGTVVEVIEDDDKAENGG